MNAKPIGSIPFIDSITRDAFLDGNGRQYVFDDDGQRVYGTWIYVDEPEIVERLSLTSLASSARLHPFTSASKSNAGAKVELTTDFSTSGDADV